MQQLLPGSVFAIVVKALSHHLLLGDLVQLADSIGQDPVSGRGELGVSRVVHVVEVSYDELNLVLVSDCGSEGLELKLLHLLSFAVRNGFYDCVEVFLILRKYVDWLAVRIVVANGWL